MTKNENITDGDIYNFIKWPHLFGHYIGYDKLAHIHGQWIKDVFYRRTLESLQAHRGSYKTTALIIVGAIWYLMFINADATIGTIRKSDDEAQKIGKTVKEHFESKELLLIAKYLYDSKIKTLKTSSWSNSSFTISIKKSKTPEGSFEARGKSSSLTGTHYDIVLPDDLITLKDRTSKAERESTFDVVYELQNNIVNPNGFIFYSGTPWHKDDAWKIMPEPVRYPIGSLALPHITPEFIADKKRSNTSSLYAANYLLKHISDEDAIFPEPEKEKWPEKRFKKISAWLDPSYRGENTTALALYGFCNNKHYVRGWVWPDSVEACYTKIINRLTEYNCGTLYVETNADKGFSARDLRIKWPAVIDRNESMNKHIKIISHLKKNWDDIIFAEDCQDEFLNQIMDYQEGEEPDDAPDALAALLREMKIYNIDEILHRRFAI